MNKLNALRAHFDQHGIDGYLIPRADLHQGEEVAACDERLAFISGFTGSAGLALVTRDGAHLFVDGRYTLQGPAQAPLFDQHDLHDDPAHQFVENFNGLNGGVVGFDPWLFTKAQIARFPTDKIKPLDDNLVDKVWEADNGGDTAGNNGAKRPAPPTGAVWPHPLALAGATSAEKCALVANALNQMGARAAVLTLPDSIAWLLNIRGQDLRNTPVVLGLAIITDQGAIELFINSPERINFDINAVVRDKSAFLTALNKLAADEGPAYQGPAYQGPADQEHGDELRQVAKILVDGRSAPMVVSARLGARVLDKPDPIIAMKAVKNAAEIVGIKAAHVRDARAVTDFIAYIKAEGPGACVDELSAVDKLRSLRARDPDFIGDSFDTISGAGPNGAIVHYRADEDSNRVIANNSLYLVDSGGQYRDGTTDITRTIAIGTPTAQMRSDYTRVLKGHIALAQVTFPKGTTGQALDILARQFLWQVGLDFDHGTGHGVGAVLSVHEGPARIAKPTAAAPVAMVALEPGMVLSNEPGLYRAGAYGIRFENLVLVVERPDLNTAQSRTFYGFETISFAPIDHDLLDDRLLTDHERAWIDTYERQVSAALASGA